MLNRILNRENGTTTLSCHVRHAHRGLGINILQLMVTRSVFHFHQLWVLTWPLLTIFCRVLDRYSQRMEVVYEHHMVELKDLQPVTCHVLTGSMTKTASTRILAHVTFSLLDIPMCDIKC